MRGRLAGAILDHMKLSDLVAKTEVAYINLAVKLASDAEFRESVQTRMAEARAILYNDIEPVRALEAFLERVAEKVSITSARSF